MTKETRQCPSCGGICKKSGCERANTGLWIRALEMEFTDDGSPHTKSYHLGWQAGIEAAAQQIEQSDLQNVRGMGFLAPMLMGIAAHLRGMK